MDLGERNYSPLDLKRNVVDEAIKRENEKTTRRERRRGKKEGRRKKVNAYGGGVGVDNGI